MLWELKEQSKHFQKPQPLSSDEKESLVAQMKKRSSFGQATNLQSIQMLCQWAAQCGLEGTNLDYEDVLRDCCDADEELMESFSRISCEVDSREELRNEIMTLSTTRHQVLEKVGEQDDWVRQNSTAIQEMALAVSDLVHEVLWRCPFWLINHSF